MFVKFVSGTRENLTGQTSSRIVTICGKCQTSLCHLIVPFKSCLFFTYNKSIYHCSKTTQQIVVELLISQNYQPPSLSIIIPFIFCYFLPILAPTPKTILRKLIVNIFIISHAYHGLHSNILFRCNYGCLKFVLK